ncbi:MAG: N-acetylmuramoyl-L-alanine amidase [Syntrophomonadaceae bacterium]|nr:N-acetylmuramoyl-L-alanine amidase [Syntrophomonadaceae bacterium]
MFNLMKIKYFLALLAFTVSLYISFLLSPIPDQASAATGIVTGSVVNIRAGAGTQYAIAGTVYKDTTVTILSKSGDWYQIQCGQTVGWVNQSLLSAEAGSVQAKTPTQTPTPTVILDGQQMQFNVAPQVENGRILVPLRAIFEAMGASVQWNQDTLTATATRGSTTVVMPLNSVTPIVNGKIWPLDVPGKVVNERILAPLRFVGEALGGTVVWDNASYSAVLQSPSTPSTGGSAVTVTAVKVGDYTVNLRSGPDTTYAAVDSATAGEILPVAAQQNGWYQVSRGGTKAWVAGWLVSPTTGGQPADPPVVSNPDPVDELEGLTLSSQRTSAGVSIIMESADKLDKTVNKDTNQVRYVFDDMQISGTSSLKEYLGNGAVTATGSNQGDNAVVTIQLPSGVKYQTSTENNGRKEILFIPNFISSVSRSTFGSSGEKIAVTAVTSVGYTTETESDQLEVTFKNALPGWASPSYTYSKSLIKSMEIESKGKDGSVLTITTVKPAKFSVGLNSDGTTLNILFIDRSEWENRDPIVVLDAGHGGSDPGASGSYLKEKDVSLAVTLKAGQLLTAKGIRVIYTRTDDTFVELIDRSDIANFYNAAVFVSVHCNASTSRTPSGTETYCYYPLEDPQLYLQKDERYNLALRLQQALVANLGLNDRGVKEMNLSVLRESTMPSALVELGFISTPTEEALMQQQQFKDRAAEAIANAIAGYMQANVK